MEFKLDLVKGLPARRRFYAFGTAAAALWTSISADVLMEIFQRVKSDAIGTSTPNRWIHVTHVCHYWRQVALSSPLMWREIVIPGLHEYKQPGRLKAQLQRSGKAPLRLHVNNVSPNDSLGFQVIADEAHRLEELYLRSVGYWKLCSDILSSSLPMLRKLHVHLLWYSDLSPSTSTFPVPSTPDPSRGLERLESVSFNGYPSPYLLPFLRPTIKHLSLHSIRGGSLTDFLIAACDMPLLENISLMLLYHDHEHNPSIEHQEDSSMPTVRLHFLNTLHIANDSVSHSVRLLEHLKYPSTACVSVETTSLPPKSGIPPVPPIAKLTELTLGRTGGATEPTETIRVRYDVFLERQHVTLWRDDRIHVTKMDGKRTAKAEPRAFERDPASVLGSPICEYITDLPVRFDPAHTLRTLTHLCLNAPLRFGFIRTLIIKDITARDTTDTVLSNPFHHLVHLEEVYMDKISWAGLAYFLRPGRAPDGTLEDAPFSRLKLLSLRNTRFYGDSRQQSPETVREIGYSYSPGRTVNHCLELPVDELVNELASRRNAGVQLGRLVITEAVAFNEDDAALLREVVGVLDWDRRTGDVAY
ncbi:hypothetical protein BXZ70DRAFT_1009357 [Cristinia sonorae]|uniref:F-box domain-containing protein n=1 Tax=Cristinia sonorae TaxID=1940300 RepID=A0A8K0ULL3_9AGAR|nr:hypothetical protein BXZ70DRAFT_1009357 [Cristinia sonorae]